MAAMIEKDGPSETSHCLLLGDQQEPPCKAPQRVRLKKAGWRMVPRNCQEAEGDMQVLYKH